MNPEKNKRVRIRVNGLLVRNESLLLVKLQSPVSGSLIWMPPGGGLEFGESTADAIVREMKEETGLKVRAGRLRYIHEVISPHIHALELYYDCHYISGDVQLGTDPELQQENQILQDVAFIPFQKFEVYPVVPNVVKKYLQSDLSTGFDGVREDRTFYEHADRDLQ